MTLPASPPISLSDVCAEFAAPAGTPLGSFLRGGTYVPNTPANAGVPTTLPISLTQLLGASSSGGGGGGGSVNIADHAIVSSRGTGLALATYKFNGSGTVQWALAGGSSGTYSGEWLLSGTASAFEVRVSGALMSALSGIPNATWQTAAINWSAQLDAGPVPEERYEMLIVELRPAGGGAVLDTAYIDLTAERF